MANGIKCYEIEILRTTALAILNITQKGYHTVYPTKKMWATFVEALYDLIL